MQRLEGEGRATWYRYHAMLQDLLHTRLRRMPEQESLALAGRARGWLLDEGFDDAAVGLSFWMRDYGAICDIIEQRWEVAVDERRAGGAAALDRSSARAPAR